MTCGQAFSNCHNRGRVSYYPQFRDPSYKLQFWTTTSLELLKNSSKYQGRADVQSWMSIPPLSG